MSNDIGIPVLATDAPAAPARLAAETDVPREGEEVVLVGFGDMAPLGRSEVVRKRSGVMRIDRTDDDLIHALPDPATACSHDSGGAGFIGDSLAGILSGGDAYCRRFTDFARVDTHRDFLDGALASLPNPTCPSFAASGM